MKTTLTVTWADRIITTTILSTTITIIRRAHRYSHLAIDKVSHHHHHQQQQSKTTNQQPLTLTPNNSRLTIHMLYLITMKTKTTNIKKDMKRMCCWT